MVLRARWILGGGVAADRTVDDEGTDEDGAVLLLGPQTLILALPDAEDGDDMTELGDFTLLPVKRGKIFFNCFSPSTIFKKRLMSTSQY